MVRLYHERWEIESVFFAFRRTLRSGHVLRSSDPIGMEQETWALLTLYQLLRMAMVDAIEARPGTDPDRASFTTAMEAARDRSPPPQGLPGRPCRPARRHRPGGAGHAAARPAAPVSARKVKCPTSRYHDNDDTRPPFPPRSPRSTSLSHPARRPGARRTHRDRRNTPRPPQPPTRRERITAIITSQPPRDWSGHELAILLTSNPGPCSPSSANGHGWVSSPDRLRHLRTQHAASNTPSTIPPDP